MLRKWLFNCVILLISVNVNAQKIQKVKVVSVPLYITSSFQISCNQFDKSFVQIKKEVLLKESKIIKEINGLFSMFVPIKLKGINVRGKLILCNGKGKTKEICFDEFGHFFKDDAFYENKKLFNFLLSNHFIEY